MSKLDELIKNINKEAKEEIISEGMSGFEYDRIPFTSPRLNYCTFGGIPVGKITEFYGENHGGKALALDCKVLTPNGYVEMRDIKVGTEVIDGNGKVTKVVGVYPQGVRDMYRLTLSDHTTIDCSDEHLWSVYKRGDTKLQTVSLREMLDTYEYTSPITNRPLYFYSLPTPTILDIDVYKDALTDMYTVGTMLVEGADYYRCIPEKYLYTSVENRYDLLMGMMDIRHASIQCNSDGGIDFQTKHPKLSKDFSFLVRSLGGVDSVVKRGEYYEHSWMIVPDCGLSRFIVNIEKIERAECQCIKVASDCHTFIVENEIVTHNTTTSLDIIANYQRMPNARKVLYVDAENTLDKQWAEKLGVKVDEMIILQPKEQSAEALFEIILKAMETDEIGLWVLDSIGVLVSGQELEKSMEEKTYGGIAKALTLFSRKATQLMKRHECTGIGINQVRENLSSPWGGLTTPGGKAWQHCCAVRMQFSRGKFIDEKGNELTRAAENPAGNIVMVSMTKNKTCPPTRRTGFYTLNYYTGIDYLKDLVDVGIKEGYVDKAGSWYSVVDKETGEVVSDKVQGTSKLYELLENDSELLQKLENWVDSALME